MLNVKCKDVYHAGVRLKMIMYKKELSISHL